MSLPFTTEQFLGVFRQYNTVVWPAPVILGALAILAAVRALRGVQARLVLAYLALQWAWTGLVYHWGFFTRINPAAWLFGALWLAGAVAFALNAAGTRHLAFRTPSSARFVTGTILIVYALIAYPIIGQFGGRPYPSMPTYGAPCPVTIATFGLLWLAKAPFPRYLLIAPILWAAVGSMAAFSLGVYEDLGLLVSGVSGVVLLILRPSPADASRAAVHPVR